MSRIAAAFAAARRAAFVPYVTAGDPNLERTVELVGALRRAGADVVELGVPFSDPIADGPTNQRAAERALASGTTLRGVLAAVREIRTAEDVPIVLFTYSNPLVRYGIERFAEDAAASGVDGVLLTDVPVEEIGRFAPALRRSQLDPIMLVTPTSTEERVKRASEAGSGFLYLVSRTGVTGTRQHLEEELAAQVRAAQRLSQLPVAVGFGISTPAQVREVARIADGVVVGSAIVDRIGRLGDCAELAGAVEGNVFPLAEACRR